jgi:hypothetical protein
VLLAGLALLVGAAVVTAILDRAIAADGPLALFVLGAALIGGGLVVATHRALPARWLLATLLLVRVFFWFADPAFSDDIFRYVHEGRASQLGLATPYATPPAEITPLPDDGITARVNHPEIPAAYPPLSQLVFLALAGIGDGLGAPLTTFELFFGLCDVLVVLLLYRRRQRWPGAWVVYAAHPIPLLEVAWGAHLDALGVYLMIAGAIFLATGARGRHRVAGALLIGLAAGVKPIALLALLIQPLRLRSLVLTTAVAIAGAALPAVPYLLQDAPLTSGLVQYSTRWEAQPTGYALIESLVEPAFTLRHERQRYTHLHLARSPAGLLLDVSGEPQLSAGDARRVSDPILVDERLFARALAAAVFALILGALLLQGLGPWTRTAWAFGALWLLAPTVHPWYFLWLLPFAAVARSRALVLWAASGPLAYEVVVRANAGEPWDEAAWPRVLGLLALGGGLAWDVVASRQRARESRGMGDAR